MPPRILAACLFFRNSAAYLHEWLLFHQVQGIARFYLYESDSTDDYAAVLAPWIRAGVVRLHHWPVPGLAQQQAVYDHCLRTIDADVEWLAFIDDDEFLFSTDLQPLPGILRSYAAFAGVAVAWQLYGSSGLLNVSNTWVIEQFTRRGATPDQHVKCIVRPERVIQSKLIGHAFVPRDGFSIVDEHFAPLTEPLHPNPSCDKLRINHYIIKSWDEFTARRLSRRELKHLEMAQWLEWDEAWSKESDPCATAFIPAMRALERQMQSG